MAPPAPPAFGGPAPLAPPPGRDQLLFVVDVANVAMRHGVKGSFSTRGIRIAMDYLRERFAGNCRFAAFLPEYMLDAEKVAAKRRAHALNIKTAKAQELPDDVLYLQRLERDGVLVATPSQDYDDSYQIEYARRHGGVVVTNDLFRDAVDKLKPHMRGAMREWLRSRILSYAFVGDEFIPNPDFCYPVAVAILAPQPVKPPPPPRAVDLPSRPQHADGGI
ncbi:Zc3h12a-like ribonuclease NYN domain-containing protein [Pelagophyceae sp. CCMP2097]|nr:Zc3h12a-like ribonuclease NYN domain-containing protein [Pelagophyceae sp. CCMP2097]